MQGVEKQIAGNKKVPQAQVLTRPYWFLKLTAAWVCDFFYTILGFEFLTRYIIENGGNIWEQLSEALNAKKEELSQGNSWDKASSGKSSWSYRALKGSALGPTMALLRSKNKLWDEEKASWG